MIGQKSDLPISSYKLDNEDDDDQFFVKPVLKHNLTFIRPPAEKKSKKDPSEVTRQTSYSEGAL